MKVKALTRNPDDYLRATKRDIYKVPRNYDPVLHPFEGPREYTRALNAVKLERIFAKPFVGNLDGHREGVCSLAKHPKRVSLLVSGAYDGEVRVWDIARQVCLSSWQAHDGWVRGICFAPSGDGESFWTVGDDSTIKIWNADSKDDSNRGVEPCHTIISKSVLTSVSHQWDGPLLATSGDFCQIWEESRDEPLQTHSWGVDSLYSVSFNPIQTNVLAACASDRSMIFYDVRMSGPIRKVVMRLRSNKVAWNPMEAFVFTCASEDYNLYSFDARNLAQPFNVHMDHTSAVTDVDYSPTGKEFVSGSYDKSIRFFELDKGHSRDVYHTKRMQRLTCVSWSLDAKYIASASDEMNIRIWKARAAEKLGVLKPREKRALEYSQALREKFAFHPQIKRIARHRQVPKHIYNAQRELRAIKDKTSRKDANRRAHSKPGTVPHVPERKRHVIEEKE
ncbi:DDB1- and CUL4-associated factor 13 isoform X1 [Ischnura elegans]|uniref:DDB1- and CUL4-associated factor 13 isoform X1 n=1 Tax=Ischnura elegans TaxID=197161 RepID=UPI001ED87E8D|nr:DDB1- and CUL4-associated factor 13 isoform X1 [Ischnura elegans]